MDTEARRRWRKLREVHVLTHAHVHVVLPVRMRMMEFAEHAVSHHRKNTGSNLFHKHTIWMSWYKDHT